MARKLFFQHLESKEMLSFNSWGAGFGNTSDGADFLAEQRAFGATQNVTNTAGGLWSNHGIWDGAFGDKPNINIAAGTTVTLNINSYPVGKLNVYGTLIIGDDTSLTVDTIYVHSGGKLLGGSPANGITANIIFTGDAATDNMSNGLIAMPGSEIKLYGEAKLPFAKLYDVYAGSSMVTVQEYPSNWKIGDKVVISATDFQPGFVWNGSHDEVRTILNIDGNTIILSDALDYDHAGLPVYIVNLSKTLKLKTGYENPTISQRAHAMIMTTNTVLFGVGFEEMGRTDKNIRTEPVNPANVQGRYPVHVHRTGPTNAALLIEQCAVVGSPGWGFVNHDANVNMIDNVSYNVLGAHFVTERGNEAGSMIGNIAILAKGTSDLTAQFKDGVNKALYTGLETGDLARHGHGFWLQSRNIYFEGNVSISTHEAGMIWFHRSLEVLVPTTVSTLLTPHKSIAYGATTIDSDKVPLVHIKNNTVIGAYTAFQVVKARPTQGHGVNNVIDGFTSYNTIIGIHLEYTAKYILKNFNMNAYPNAHSNGDSAGFLLKNNTQQVSIEDSTINGFKNGIFVGEEFVALGPDDTPDFVAVDTNVLNTVNPFAKNIFTGPNQGTYYVPDPFLNQYISSSSIGAPNIPVSYTIDPNQGYNLNKNLNDQGQFLDGGWSIIVRGTKTDSLGTSPLRWVFDFNDIKRLANIAGRFTSNGKNYVIMLAALNDRHYIDQIQYETIIFEADKPELLYGPLQNSLQDLIDAHKSYLNL